MLDQKDIRLLAKARLKDAQVLLRGKRYGGALYLCGYAIEFALKARICQTLRWSGYPETTTEFGGYTSLRTHNLEVLLHLSGIEVKIKTKMLAEWSVVNQWTPESRYSPIGKATQADASLMIASTKKLLSKI